MYKYLNILSVTRSCFARYTFVFLSLHVRVPRVTRTCNGFCNGLSWNIFTNVSENI